MTDRVSNDTETAAYLARQDHPADEDGPSRAEAAQELEEQRAFEAEWRRRARENA